MGQSLIKSIPCPIREAAGTFPDRTALIDTHQSFTYHRLDDAIDSAVTHLRERGIAPGDIVAVLANNSISYAILFFAGFRLGFTLMPLNIRLTESDWRNQLDKAECKLLVYGDRFKNTAASLSDKTISIDKFGPSDPTFGIDTDSEMELDRDALIIFSSGSAGDSHGVVLSWSNLYYSSKGIESILLYEANDCWLAVLPFFHIGGISILFRAALAWCGAYILDRFNSDAVIKVIAGNRIHYLSVVPTMLSDLIQKDRQSNLGKLKAIIVGGAPFDESLRREVINRQLPVLTTFGMTETSSMVTLLPPGYPSEKLATAGKILPHRELIITNKNNQPVASGENGRIMVSGEVLFSRYLDGGQGTINPEGWFDTGDMGHFDIDGYLTVTGRDDNIIISGGENIDLNQIENAIGTIDGITNAAIMARLDKKWGARPVAFVEVSDSKLSEDSIAEKLRGILPSIMVPDRIMIVVSIPLTGSGKYDRQALREQHREIFTENSVYSETVPAA
jgi:O-succinylbenzoic acid--CoA ligase